MPKPADFDAIFEQLKTIYTPYAERLVLTADDAGNYSLNTPYSAQYKKEVFFGAVQIKKNYVSFHLMPVYIYPDLLAGLSDELKKRMQGKSCFNFKSSDERLFAELVELTEASVARLEQEKLLPAS
jgi:hypothetical protein